VDDKTTLKQGFLGALPFSSVSIILLVLRTHSFILHRRYTNSITTCSTYLQIHPSSFRNSSLNTQMAGDINYVVPLYVVFSRLLPSHVSYVHSSFLPHSFTQLRQTTNLSTWRFSLTHPLVILLLKR
jgi:hypothetical protein